MNAVEQKNLIPLIVKSTFNPENEMEAIETISTFMEKNGTHYDESSKMMKEYLDKRFGANHQVVIGESYGYDISHDSSHLLHCYFGNTSLLVWKKQ